MKMKKIEKKPQWKDIYDSKRHTLQTKQRFPSSLISFHSLMIIMHSEPKLERRTFNPQQWEFLFIFQPRMHRKKNSFTRISAATQIFWKTWWQPGVWVCWSSHEKSIHFVMYIKFDDDNHFGVVQAWRWLATFSLEKRRWCVRAALCNCESWNRFFQKPWFFTFLAVVAAFEVSYYYYYYC
jgi:hypothetical protein